MPTAKRGGPSRVAGWQRIGADLRPVRGRLDAVLGPLGPPRDDDDGEVRFARELLSKLHKYGTGTFVRGEDLHRLAALERRAAGGGE